MSKARELLEMTRNLKEEDAPKAENYANDDYKIHSWFERDRSHVELRNETTDETVVEWWDEDLQSAIEGGFLNPRDFLSSAMEYAEEHGLISKNYRPGGGDDDELEEDESEEAQDSMPHHDKALREFMVELPWVSKPNTLDDVDSVADEELPQEVKEAMMKTDAIGLAVWEENDLPNSGMRGWQYWAIETGEDAFFVDTQGYDYPRYVCRMGENLIADMQAVFSARKDRVRL